jgi:hypothetical protein
MTTETPVELLEMDAAKVCEDKDATEVVDTTEELSPRNSDSDPAVIQREPDICVPITICVLFILWGIMQMAWYI